ncbi:MAG TPA: alpha/beta fold hydrolase, partial [Longimicrobiaceae bacterium]|nr:alpha/beta fold hydrolase [Longimicrobiaceae bacterium]
MTDAAAPGPWQHREAAVGGVRLHYVEAGAGPPVVPLHGFPEFWYGWRLQVPALAEAGFRAVAPDMRGYNLSDKPRGVDAYRVERLVEDVGGLGRHLGTGRAHLVGHDWGGVVAWYFAMLHPELLDRHLSVDRPGAEGVDGAPDQPLLRRARPLADAGAARGVVPP